MHRRALLLTAAAIAAWPAMAAEEYVPGLVDAKLAAGEVVFLDYTATWCSTCRSQGRTISALRAADPSYDAKVSFVDVDWDTYARDEITTRYAVPRRSTLIAIGPNGEIGRIVAGTREADIKALMDAAVAAAG